MKKLDLVKKEEQTENGHTILFGKHNSHACNFKIKQNENYISYFFLLKNILRLFATFVSLVLMNIVYSFFGKPFLHLYGPRPDLRSLPHYFLGFRTQSGPDTTLSFL